MKRKRKAKKHLTRWQRRLLAELIRQQRIDMLFDTRCSRYAVQRRLPAVG